MQEENSGCSRKQRWVANHLWQMAGQLRAHPRFKSFKYAGSAAQRRETGASIDQKHQQVGRRYA